MKLQITANAYHLRYAADDDRIVLSVDISSEQELGMAITRRLTRNFIAALAKFVAERVPAAKAPTPIIRETILDFEHSASVANAVAEGNMRETPRETEKKPIGPPSLVREVKLVPKPDGGLGLVFDDNERLLTLDVAPERLHMVIETFVQIAERAGWDFPPLASWLSSTKQAGIPAGKTVN
jgi:hypothetical protein